MKVLTASANRLGNRPSNQDRWLVVEQPGRVLLAVADGMGGHARGDLAAQAAVDSLQRSFTRQQGRIADAAAFLQRALETAHLDVVDAGHSCSPPIRPRTTCVVCLVQDDQAHWAHVGDSRLYLLRSGRLVTRTRDHTPVENLLRRGDISEDELRTHPLRNSVNRCLGGTPALPKISLDRAALKTNDTLLLCSDGLWSALPEHRLIEIPSRAELGQIMERLSDEAQTATYPHTDNVSAVGLRWLSAAGSRRSAPESRAADGGAAPQSEDPLKSAIDDIHRAMLDYAAEMKRG
jgi:serine/threonine protein phosphatase PrpC